MSNQWKMNPPSDWLAVPVNENGETLVHMLFDGDAAGVESGWVRPDDMETLQVMLRFSLEFGTTVVWDDGVRVFVPV